ncbi:MAG: drug/metabolite transporter (DMT)-like permease [Gammaproteobacteria bacterium]
MFKNSATLYLITVLIWGSTWYAIKFQLGVVAAEVSLVYRFGLAAVILLIYCQLTQKSLRFEWQQHAFIALQGLFLFSTNYLIFYWATGLLTSGIVALLFSTVILMNIINGWILLGERVRIQVMVGAMIGIAGIAAVFWSEVAIVETDADSLQGLWLCLIATFVASIGNILSARNQKNNLPVLQSNAWGMMYGTMFMVVYALISGVAFNFDATIEYSLSLIYLSIFGSIFAFGCYLTLIGRIGADKSAYAAVLFPIIALGISTIFESYVWSLQALFGFILVLVGNVLVITSKKRLPA